MIASSICFVLSAFDSDSIFSSLLAPSGSWCVSLAVIDRCCYALMIATALLLFETVDDFWLKDELNSACICLWLSAVCSSALPKLSPVLLLLFCRPLLRFSCSVLLTISPYRLLPFLAFRVYGFVYYDTHTVLLPPFSFCLCFCWSDCMMN